MVSEFSQYVNGRRLYGDDFDESQIREWFADEAEGYADLVQEPEKTYQYHYHGLNRALGYSRLGDRRFRHALGFGSAYGDEFMPISNRIDRLTIVDPSDEFTSSDVCGTPCCYVQPEPSGILPFTDGTFDLVTCFGVLHHIPNVSAVLDEIRRCLEPGGAFLLREPTGSMGDWSEARAGLTKRERGLPRDWLQDAVTAAGFSIIAANEIGFRPLGATWAKLSGRSVYDTAVGTLADRMLASAFRWNYRYHATSIWERFRPSAIYLVLRKEGKLSDRCAA